MTNHDTPGSRCRVGLVGFGTVGQAVGRILSNGRHRSLQLTHICNRDVDRKRVDWVDAEVVWTESFDTLLDGGVDVVVELIGGTSPAEAWMDQALMAGKAVVTANKQVMALAGANLLARAQAQGRPLLFEAAVGGGIPLLRSLHEGISGDQIRRIHGILNGTCNYILNRMERDRVSLDKALRDAQRLGFAEADPTADVDGLDAQAKLALLVGVGFGRTVRVADIPVQPITAVSAVDIVYANRLGCVIRQVARAEFVEETEELRADVLPALVPTTSSLARAQGSQNIVVVEGVHGGETAFSGFGAGGPPTAVAVVSDLLAIAHHRASPEGWLPSGEPYPVIREFEASHYVRFLVRDRPGVVGTLAQVFSGHSINLDAVLQEPGWPKDALPFVVTLETCPSTAVEAALADMADFDFHVQPPLWLPILGESVPYVETKKECP